MARVSQLELAQFIAASREVCNRQLKYLEDLPEIPEVLGTIILDKSADDMEYYLDNECFPNNDGAPKRSESARTERADRGRGDDAQPTGRRTPSRRGDSSF